MFNMMGEYATTIGIDNKNTLSCQNPGSAGNLDSLAGGQIGAYAAYSIGKQMSGDIDAPHDIGMLQWEHQSIKSR